MSDGRDNIDRNDGIPARIDLDAAAEQGPWPDHLASQDQHAVDRLAALGWRCSSESAQVISDDSGLHAEVGTRTHRVASLLAMLDADLLNQQSTQSLSGAVSQDVSADLCERTLARINAARSQGSACTNATLTGDHAAYAPDAELSIDDQEALDALMLSSFSSRRVPSSLRERAQRIEAMADLVSGTPIANELRADLVEATAAAVQRTPRVARSIEPSGWRGGGWRLADLISVAAVLLIGASVLWPVAASVRAHSLRTGCASNLTTVASAMGVYSNDFAGNLPMATAGFGGGTWWNVGAGPGKSNSANLFTLARERYATLTDLACGGNSNAVRGHCGEGAQDWRSISEVSYSYQILDREAGANATWSRQPESIILADRSPVTLRAARGEPIYTLENSPNHSGRGQRVLRNDGSTVWLSTPEYHGDNIWLPGQLEAIINTAREMQRSGLERGIIHGNELPVSPTDTFVGP